MMGWSKRTLSNILQRGSWYRSPAPKELWLYTPESSILMPCDVQYFSNSVAMKTDPWALMVSGNPV